MKRKRGRREGEVACPWRRRGTGGLSGRERKVRGRFRRGAGGAGGVGGWVGGSACFGNHSCRLPFPYRYPFPPGLLPPPPGLIPSPTLPRRRSRSPAAAASCTAAEEPAAFDGGGDTDTRGGRGVHQRWAGLQQMTMLLLSAAAAAAAGDKQTIGQRHRR